MIVIDKNISEFITATCFTVTEIYSALWDEIAKEYLSQYSSHCISNRQMLALNVINAIPGAINRAIEILPRVMEVSMDSNIDDEAQEKNIVQISKEVSKVWARCFHTAHDCHSRAFGDIQEAQDRTLISQIASDLFNNCMDLINGQLAHAHFEGGEEQNFG